MTPELILSLFWNMNLMNRLTSLATRGVVGHNKVDNLFWLDNCLNPGIRADNFSNKQLHVFLNTSQCSIKCCSESTKLLPLKFEFSAPSLATASGSGGLVWQ